MRITVRVVDHTPGGDSTVRYGPQIPGFRAAETGYTANHERRFLSRGRSASGSIGGARQAAGNAATCAPVASSTAPSTRNGAVALPLERIRAPAAVGIGRTVGSHAGNPQTAVGSS